MTDNTINACPECDSSSLRVRVTDRQAQQYKCKDCGNTFDRPTIREKQANGVGADTMLERIVDDPEALKERTEL
jgi:ribosomal protein L37AE/L43A